MKKLRKWVDHVACILPFEEAFLRRAGVDAKFVGHPLLEVPTPTETRAIWAARAGLDPSHRHRTHPTPTPHPRS